MTNRFFRYTFLFRYKKNTFFIVSILLILIICSLFIYRQNFLPCIRLGCLDISIDNKLYLKDIYEEKAGSVFRAMYQIGQGPGLLRVDVRGGIDPATAQDYIHGRIAGMKALYDNIRSPYPGLLSQEIICDDPYKPSYTYFKTSSDIEINEIDGFLTDRLVFGACTKEQIAYKGMTLLFNCPARKQLYDIEFIAPLASYPQEQFAAIAKSLQCR